MSIPSIRAFILDMDGVLWRSDQPIGNLAQIFDLIRHKGYAVVLATNNSSRTVDQYLQHLAGFGVDGLEPWQIVTSAEALGDYLQEKYPAGGPVFVVGEDGLLEAMRKRDFYIDHQHALAVAVGLDRQVTYQKLSHATQLIRAGADFIASNPDRTFPTPEGLVPGAGALVTAIQTATDVQPIIVGKPDPYMYQVALRRLGLTAAQTMVVGDRLDTDIQGAQVLGCRTALVLSGVSTEAEALRWQPAPDWIGSDLATLVESLPPI